MGRCAEILLDPKTGLTPKETAFTKEFLATGNAGAAAEKVYNVQPEYARSVGSHVLDRPDVAAVIESTYRRENMNEDYVLGGLHTYAEKGKVDHRWAGPGVTALDRIGRFVGMFKDSDGGGDKITLNLIGLSSDKLEQYVEKLAGRIGVKLASPTGNEKNAMSAKG